MMMGELEYRKENYDLAFALLEQAALLDDALYYSEPWAWMHPPRHALGALLLEQGRVSEAERVYCADLGIDNSLSRPSQHPNNVWSLHGYVECLERSGRPDQARDMKAHLDVALEQSDRGITSSCACRTRF
jgi:Flp pilus assembly protein TadD